MLERFNFLHIHSSRDILFKIGLILVSIIPLCLLFSRAVADFALSTTGTLFLIHSLKLKNFKFMKQPIAIVLIMLWLWFLVGATLGMYRGLDTIITSFAFIRYILFFFACTTWLFIDIEALKFAGKIITITIIIALIDSLLQFSIGVSLSGHTQISGRLTSFLRRPDIGIYFAKLIFPIVSIHLLPTTNGSNRTQDLLSHLLLFVTICTIILTGERTATALTIMTIITILLLIGFNNNSLRIYMFTGALGATGLIAALIYNSNFLYERFTKFISDTSDFSHSLYGQLFKAAIITWQEHEPLIGVGLRKFRKICLVIEEQGQVNYCDLHPHNLYLEILSESGIVGFILFCSFVILCCRLAIRTATKTKYDIKMFVNSLYAQAGLFIILFPVSVTMSFITNWSGTLNWLGISLSVSILQHLYFNSLKA